MLNMLNSVPSDKFYPFGHTNLMETHFEENRIEEKQSNLLQGNTPVI